jgi:hypothetical protein
MPPHPCGMGSPSARSSIGMTVRVARTSSNSIIFAFSVFTGVSFLELNEIP